LRIQPELLVNAYYTVSVALTPILINPVSGADNKSIQSFWGDSREGGKRRHEGVDIFARKGTPVIAPTNGTVSRVGTSKLGGKVVWMHDQKRGHSYYFAHLDSQFVKPGTRVKQGDILGTVGNTGNARHTPAHLHFGIYQTKAKDPLHYIKTLERQEKTLAVDTSFKFLPYTIASNNTAVRRGPGDNFASMQSLDKDTYLNVIAQSKDWYRVLLPNEKQGFIMKKSVIARRKGKELMLNESKQLLSDVRDGQSMVKVLGPSTKVEMLGKFENYRLVRTREGIEGWIAN
jgi:SH3-like domain-containing protein/biotin carboxyl carrier protein